MLSIVVCCRLPDLEAKQRHPPPARSSQSEGWQKASRAMRAKHKLTPFNEHVYTVPSSAGFTARVKDLLDVGFQMNSRNPEALFCDVSQSVQHTPWVRSKLRSITTSSRYWSYSAERLLEPQELLRAFGFEPDCTGVSKHHLQNLLGECMSPPCIGIIILTLATCTPTLWT